MSVSKISCGKYVVITPVKNEGEHIEKTILSILSQKIKPVEWIFVNDNSDDNTVNIVDKYSRQNRWIRLITVEQLGITEISARIAYLFNFGVKNIRNTSYDFIMKLDADVGLDSDFCSNLISEFQSDTQLGIASGLVEYKGKREKNDDKSMTRGAAKIYRKNCWDNIGGVYLSRGWDTVDNFAAQFHGWKTRSFDYYFRHYKEEGKRSGLIRKHYWTGLFNGRIPYHPIYFILKVMRHSMRKPIIIGSIVQIFGYATSRYFKKERPFPTDISAYIRQLQHKKLIDTIRLP